jgi:adenine-specific DNA-methyltransferase
VLLKIGGTSSVEKLDDSVGSVLVKGDNFQSLNLLRNTFNTSVDLLITDPPYNTGSDGFPYKDSYLHSSWITMMVDRIDVSAKLVKSGGLLYFHIGDKNQEFRESQNLSRVLDAVVGSDNYISQLVWKNKSGGGNDSEFFAQDHEYIFCYSTNRPNAVLKDDPNAEVTTSYNRTDKQGKYALERLDKQSIRYSESGDFVIVGPDGEKYRPKHKDPRNPNATWRWSKDKIKKDYKELVFEAGNVYTRNYKKDGAVARSLLVEERFGRTRTGKTELFSLFNNEVFKNPKPTKIERFLMNVSIDTNGCVLDPFAGSGTVGHAVIQQNRLDKGTRKSLLLEQGEQFDAVLSPRILKAVYSDEWENGLPVDRKGVSHVAKIVVTETYDDTLNNLQLPNDPKGQASSKMMGDAYRLGYWLTVETAGSDSLLNVDKLEAPFEYSLSIRDGQETTSKLVDLPETFAFLIGLIVERRRVLDRDGRRYLLQLGRQRAGDVRTAVLWRDIRGWQPADFDAERRWLAKQAPFGDAVVIYVNGDSAIEGAQSLDPVFHARMFAPVH